MSWLVMRPTGQLNGGITHDLVGKISATSCKIAVRKNKTLRYVGTDDIGYFAVQGFIHPDWWKEKFLSLAGLEGTYDEANDIFKTRIGRAMPATFGLPARLVLFMVKDQGHMFRWLDHEGFGADIEEVRRIHPGLLGLEEWIEKKSAWAKKS